MEAANAKSEKLGEEGSGRVYQRSVDPLLGSDGDLDMDEGEGGMFLDDLFPKVSLDPPPLTSDGSDESDCRPGGSDRRSDGSSGECQISGPSIPCASSKVFPDPSADLNDKTLDLDTDDIDDDIDEEMEPCGLCGSLKHFSYDCSYHLYYFPPGAKIFNPKEWKEVCVRCREEMIEEKKCPMGCPPFRRRQVMHRYCEPTPPYDPSDCRDGFVC